ncbi:MAG: hypothetical protein HQL98_00890 [Magnetococcales bacterium]|nr:hypothetical protein [Magnetococcales bacterium]
MSKRFQAGCPDDNGVIRTWPSLHHPFPGLAARANLCGRLIFPLLVRFPVVREEEESQTVHTLNRATNPFNSLAMPVN